VTDILALLQDFYREKLAMLLSHQAGARLIGSCLAFRNRKKNPNL